MSGGFASVNSRRGAGYACPKAKISKFQFHKSDTIARNSGHLPLLRYFCRRIATMRWVRYLRHRWSVNAVILKVFHVISCTESAIITASLHVPQNFRIPRTRNTLSVKNTIKCSRRRDVHVRCMCSHPKQRLHQSLATPRGFPNRNT